MDRVGKHCWFEILRQWEIGERDEFVQFSYGNYKFCRITRGKVGEVIE